MTHHAPDRDLGRLLEAARRRLEEALPGSPDEDAAWQAVQELEAATGEGLVEPSPPGRDAAAG